jgi:hypothetical protein
MEPEGSCTHLLEPATSPDSEPDQSSSWTSPSHFLEIYCNMILPCTSVPTLLRFHH